MYIVLLGIHRYFKGVNLASGVLENQTSNQHPISSLAYLKATCSNN